MPKVPAKGLGQVVPFMPKPPEEVYIAMAAAEMNKRGELFDPEPNKYANPDIAREEVNKIGFG